MSTKGTIFILGANSFLAKNLYIKIKKQNRHNVILLNHSEFDGVKESTDNDIIVNFCGINRSSSKIDYEEANHLFLHKVIDAISSKPFLIHISSLMVYGFRNIANETLSDYQKWFIESKLNGEYYLRENYPEDKLTIIRPSNIYGFDCIPYYNNLLSTLTYEKINKLNKISNINKNCYRNMLSVGGFVDKMYEFIDSRKNGTYNVMSNNTLSLETIISYIYDTNIPAHIKLVEGNIDIPNTHSDVIIGSCEIINEDIKENIIQLEQNMKTYHRLKEDVLIKKCEMLVQPRGNMVEISALLSKRLYKITLTNNSVRGNHFHYEQIEEFYTNRDKVLYLLAYSNHPEIIFQYISNENDLITVRPDIIHTLTNDYPNNNPEIIITSTQEYMSDKIPDTKYINII